MASNVGLAAKDGLAAKEAMLAEIRLAAVVADAVHAEIRLAAVVADAVLAEIDLAAVVADAVLAVADIGLATRLFSCEKLLRAVKIPAVGAEQIASFLIFEGFLWKLSGSLFSLSVGL